MKRWLTGALALCWCAMPGWAAAAQIGCFSDGGVVFLHAGSTYQFYADKGDPRVDCTPAAVKIGLELTEEEAQSSDRLWPISVTDALPLRRSPAASAGTAV